MDLLDKNNHISMLAIKLLSEKYDYSTRYIRDVLTKKREVSFYSNLNSEYNQYTVEIENSLNSIRTTFTKAV